MKKYIDCYNKRNAAGSSSVVSYVPRLLVDHLMAKLISSTFFLITVTAA